MPPQNFQHNSKYSFCIPSISIITTLYLVLLLSLFYLWVIEKMSELAAKNQEYWK